VALSAVSSEPATNPGGPRRPRLLFLAYFFPPVRTIASVRSHEIAKWLVRLGWDVTVVTPETSVWKRTETVSDVHRMLETEGIRCLRTPHPWSTLASGHVVSFYDGTGPIGERVGARLARWGRRAIERLNLPPEFGWIREAERVSARLGPGRADLILATGPPFSIFAAARRLALRLRCPYVLDYRDLWFGNPWVEGPAPQKQIESETVALHDCAAVTAVTSGLAEFLANRFRVEEKIHLVPNGYDGEELEGIKPHAFENLAIVYAGTFYPPKRRIDPIMAALDRLREKAPAAAGRWALHYYGRHERHVLDAAQRFGVQDRVVVHGEVPRDESLSAVAGATVALIITSVEETSDVPDRAGVPAKVFEAIGLRTPILLIAPPGSDVEDIVRTAGLGRRFAGSEVAEMTSYLLDLMERRRPPANRPETFDWLRLGTVLDDLLRGVVASEPTEGTGGATRGDEGDRNRPRASGLRSRSDFHRESPS
jgi:glycosyltransferase involved in cell wall biosynthesis